MAKDIYSILRKRYPEAEYALMHEVSDMAGFHRSNSADYVIMNLWPSRGLSLNGIELKSFRNDWLRELKKPDKAESIFQYCDYFWLLTADDTVAKLEEIPETWGWLCIKGERIFVKKEAPKLTPKEISRHFLAAMLKRACSKDGFVRTSTIEERIDQARQSGIDESQRTINNLNAQYNELKDRVEEFKNISGIDLKRAIWTDDVKDIGRAVNFIKDGGADAIQNRLFGLEETAKDLLQSITNGLSALNEVKKEEKN